MRRRALGRLLVVLTLTIVAACGSEATGGGPAAPALRGTATVTLDVFSGVPNPTWGLDADQTAEFLSQWGDLPAGTPVEYPGLLGYRALIVDFDDGSRIWVTQGVAVEEGDGARLARVDTTRDLERWLLETGVGSVDPAVLESIRTEIGG